MHIHVEDVELAGSHAPLLLPTSLEAHSGEVTLVAGDPGYGHVALALAVAGRMVPAAGRVLVDGIEDRARLQRAVALVDLAGVSEPDGGLPVRSVLAEELALAGRPARRRDVRSFLAQHEAGELAGERWEHVPAGLRTAWLAELAGSRPGVEALVLANPDRFGGDPFAWWSVAHGLAARGLAVVVQCTHASARLLRHPVHHERGASA
ncbi:hypothetical protein [Oryzihumus leptocrescens]|uniref:hypothetical protein n=1 Tax=Oryzihumus leptocrescens TaxID=297536 RepID=UPI0011511398|nr:hypothetical protein [Oryzihumus leptocrescens]